MSAKEKPIILHLFAQANNRLVRETKTSPCCTQQLRINRINSVSVEAIEVARGDKNFSGPQIRLFGVENINFGEGFCL